MRLRFGNLFSHGRVVNNEDEMFIQFIVKGKNAFGVNLKKEGLLYLRYNFENDEFDILYLKIGEDIFVDNREK